LTEHISATEHDINDLQGSLYAPKLGKLCSRNG